MKRRKFLKSSGHIAMSSTYLYGLQSLLDICFKTSMAHAQSKVSDVNYVNIQTPGAPPRWMFDQPLNPYNKGNEFVAGSFGSQLEKVGSQFKAVYRGVKVNFGGKDLFLPPIWGQNSAHLNAPLSSLLQNSIMIRGIDMEINSHEINQGRVVRPINSQPSIHGLVADKSSKPLAALGSSGASTSSVFKSLNGISIIQADNANPIPQMIGAFQGPITKASELDYDIADIVSSLDGYATERTISSMGSEKQQAAAYEIFERNLGAFQENWSGILSKYQAIIAADLRAPFAGITNINPVGTASAEYRYNQTTTNYLAGPLKDQITNSTHMNSVAQAFAFAEFALTQELTSSVSVSTAGGLLQSLKTIGTLTNDQHFVGSVNSVYFTSLIFKAFASCLLEFTNKLKDKGIFDNTVIHIMNEFSRSPKVDGTGSDHGFRGASGMIISGMIEEPGLVGNIKVDSGESRYPGTWGVAASTIKADDRPLVNDDVVQTVCEMLEVQKIAVKGQSLVKKSGGKVTFSNSWEAKNVG